MTTNLMPWKRDAKTATPTTRRDVFPLFDLHRRMDEMFTNFFADLDPGQESGSGGLISRSLLPTMPRIDVAETDTEVVVTADLPGLDEKDLEVTLDGELLTIRGTRKEEKEEKKRNMHVSERYFGEVQRVVQIPTGVDAGKVKAAFTNGVLKVTLAKLPEAKSQVRRIEISKG